MGKIGVIQLNAQQRKDLQKAYQEGKTQFFGQLCQMVLLKSERGKSKELAGIISKCEQSINTWLNR